CADAAMDKVEKRLRRYKQRLKDRHGHGNNGHAAESYAAQSYVLDSAPVEVEEELEGWSPTVVAEQVTRLNTLSVRDAVVELEVTGASVVVFRHAGHGRVSVVYRRADGHVGWIDPSAPSVESH
ncbi:MAG: Fis family transcriptional regulator, partial [Azorhizobium sp. 35-67-5]